MAGRRKISRIRQNFIIMAIFSVLLIIIAKSLTRQLTLKLDDMSHYKNLQTLSKAIAKFRIMNNVMIPEKLSDLYPNYCSDLNCFTFKYGPHITGVESIDEKSPFILTNDIPDSFREIHNSRSLLIVTIKKAYIGGRTDYGITANLDVIPISPESKRILEITGKPVLITSVEEDYDDYSRIIERKFFIGDKKYYSIKFDYNHAGRILRQIWYDSHGEISSDFGPAFRMYNYDSSGRIRVISNHLADGTPTEVYGISKIHIEYNGKTSVKYLRRDDTLIIETTHVIGETPDIVL